MQRYLVICVLLLSLMAMVLGEPPAVLDTQNQTDTNSHNGASGTTVMFLTILMCLFCHFILKK